MFKDGQTHQLNSLNQLIDQDKHYDLNGNLVQDGNSYYRYDALDRLIEVKNEQHITTYAYDFNHRRLSKTHDGMITHYLYQGQNEIAALENDRITQLRVLGISHGAEIGAAVALELEGAAYAPIHDPHGNVVALLNTSGKVVEEYRYSAFGETEVLTNALNNPWRYSSKRYDPETGFIYYGRRYYSPDLGRWVTPDPAGFADGPNLYAYVHNHPFAYIDTDGQLAWFVVPLAMLALDYCLSATTVLLQQYVGGAMAAAFLTGMVQGYNGSVLETSALASDPSSFACEKAGACLGTILQYGNPKGWVKAGTTVATNIVGREVVHAATNVAAKKATQTWSWFSQSLARKNLPLTNQTLAKNVTKEYSSLRGVEQVVFDGKNYTKSSLQKGQKIHSAYKADIADQTSFIKEFRLPSGKKIDFVDINNGKLFELKPNNPRGIKLGKRQLQVYKGEILEMQRFKNKNWETILETY